MITAQRLFGEPDYHLDVVAADLAAYRRAYDEHLGALPGVATPDLDPRHERSRG